MESHTLFRKTRWQFSLRTILAVLTVFAASLAVVTVQLRRAARQSFVDGTVRPIVDDFVSSVGYSNGCILWLRVNDIDPHHENGFDQWEIPISMDMGINDGSFGPYKKFGDHQLRRFVSEHPHLRALDVRDSGVTDAGLIAVSKLKRLQWLWLDSNQSTELGLSHLHNVPSLRTIRLDLHSIDTELIGELENALVSCEIENNSDSAERKRFRD